MTEARILHVLPRCTGAGPERSLVATITFAPESARSLHHTIAVLDTPVSAPMFLAARRAGATMLIRPDDDALRRAAADADVVVVHYWNHPLLLSMLSRVDLGPSRVVVWSMVLGLHAPQVLTADVGRFADVLIVTTERSLASAAARTVEVVRAVPGIADMRRLDDWRPQPHDGINVGYLGVVAPTKMHPRFVELCANVRDRSVRFVVVGSGGGEEALHRRAVELEIGDRFSCTGYTDDIATALGTFDIFGYPLCEDSYATSEKALQEAMWVGIPPVVFPHGGLIDLVVDGETGLVATTEDGYAEAIDRLAGDDALRQRLGTNARGVARERFDPHRLAAAWSDALETALAMAPRERPPLHGGATGAELFLSTLDDEAGPFATLASETADETETAAAEEAIARSSAVVVGADGGLVHYRNTWPEDPLLNHWVRLARP